ncbi:hypothetical protein GDO86_010357 [Hymenochirus boettgeri]|uniref:Alpha 1,4-glycosyltransferase domain-containing protein n=1 Tax=Hymenochirus boettgeri TaxID=247094 RepID=A0A8T2JMR1_9PIPI|nr:hypothetical protein GDO86_010357 [Hymenochirus boettgeri]
MSKGLKLFVLLLLIATGGFLYRYPWSQHSTFYMTVLFSQKIKNSDFDQDTIINVQNKQPTETLKNLTERAEVKNYTAVRLSDILSQGNGIMFIETTDRMKPSPLVLCAVESAARVYSNRSVVYFMKGLPDMHGVNEESEAKKIFPTLSSFDNVYFSPLRMEDIFTGTPLLPWYKKVDPKREPYWTHVSADGCRLALIWKYGGIYMDTDIISMRPIPDVNFLAAQSSKFSSNGVFGLSTHHSFSWRCMEDFVQNYNGAVWGNQGPQLFTRVLEQRCEIPNFVSTEDIKCGNISFLNPQRFYPIPYPAWKRYYEVWDKVPTFDNSHALHLWNFMNKEQKMVVPGSNTLVDHLYKQYCPNIYNALKNNENIYPNLTKDTT